MLQNDTMQLWYSKSRQACSWDEASGLAYAPGGDLMFSTSHNTAQTWNTTVRDHSPLPCRPRLRSHPKEMFCKNAHVWDAAGVVLGVTL